MKRKDLSFYSGVFLLCMSVLMLQIVQTRILSVIAYYYLAFLTISMAMFGLTAGALLVYYGGKRFSEKSLSFDLKWVSAAYAVSVGLCLLLELASVAVTVASATGVIVWLKMILLLAAPYVFAGMAISLALTRSPFPVGIIYGFDMIGAAAGCLGALLLLNQIDGPSAIFVVAAVAAVAAVCFGAAQIGSVPADAGRFSRALSRAPLAIVVGLVVLAGLNAAISRGFQPLFVKGKAEHRGDIALERWNSYSRIIATKSKMEEPGLWGPSPTLPKGQMVEQRHLNIDGYAATTMPRFSGDDESVDFLRYDITNLAYRIRNGGRAAIIGVGSGRDLLSAHLFGFDDITGVELNPIFIRFLTKPERLRDYAGIADLPGVHFHVDDARSWFTRTDETFDLIQMSMIDTFAATGAGAFSLSENGLYTTEAWSTILSRLTPSGIFTVSRWHAEGTPVETARVISLAMSALMEMNADDPRAHIYLATSRRLSTLVIGRKRLSQDDIETLNEVVATLQFKPLIVPGQRAAEATFEDLLSAMSLDDLDTRAAKYVVDVSPATDARPFFFNHLRLESLQDLSTLFSIALSGTRSVLNGNLVANGTLALLIVLSALLVATVIILPARAIVTFVNPRFVWLTSLYFAMIGIGFMFVEIGLIQRVSIFMGHPTYGLSIVLFSIILSTGLGAFLSERAPLVALGAVATTLALYLMSLPIWLPEVLLDYQGTEILTRASVAVLVILPAGLMMGFGFPMGMRIVAAMRAETVSPWYWGVNGAAGVLAAGTAVACSIIFSTDTTIRVGALCYLALTVLWLPMLHILKSREASSPDPLTSTVEPARVRVRV